MTATSLAPPVDLADTSVLERVRRLTAEIAERAGEIERDRSVPMDLIDRLQAAGAFRMSLPRSVGGEEYGLVEASAVIAEIARADASVAWQVMVSQGMPYFASRLPERSLAALYADGPDLLIKGAFAPKGKATPVDGGYRLSGRWPLASGNFRYSKIIAGFLIHENGGVRKGPDGTMPDMRFALLDPEQVTFLDTWDAIGLRGTRSDDFTVDDVFVPEEWTGPFGGVSHFDAPYYTLPPVPTGPHHLGVVLGILQGAFDDLTKLSLTKRPAFNPTAVLCEDPVFQSELGGLEIRYAALSALNAEQAALMMNRARQGQQPTALETSRFQAATSHVHHEGMRLINEIVRLAGSGAIYSSHPLQRRFRDLRAACQHVSAQTSLLTTHGRVLTESAR